jgi:hypothetical protein
MNFYTPYKRDQVEQVEQPNKKSESAAAQLVQVEHIEQRNEIGWGGDILQAVILRRVPVRIYQRTVAGLR